MQLKELNYNLPKELIAQYPLVQRDNAKLLVLNRKTKKIEHKQFFNLVDYFSAGDVLVLNNTKVIPARLLGWRKNTKGKVDLLLRERLDKNSYKVLIKPARALKLNEEIVFDGGKINAKIIDVKEKIVSFNADVDDILNEYGKIPLPPYIKRLPQDSDKVAYQTIYAKETGSIASPAAGLHFTKKLLEEITKIGVKIIFVTLHVGYGTFKTITTNDIREHKLEEESFEILKEDLEIIHIAKTNKKKIFSVGTTSTRVLETVASTLDLKNKTNIKGKTSLFIYPGYNFKIIDHLITNFHLPHTSLLALVYAFAGQDLTKKTYLEAIDNKYRFYSYGDSMLII